MTFAVSQNKALSILAKSTYAVLGQSSPVGHAIERAIRTEEAADLTLAGLVFDALPGGKRRKIGQAADLRARLSRKLTRATEGERGPRDAHVVEALQQLGLRRVTIAKPWSPRRRLDPKS
ncbi:MAG: hypothetical protein FJX46_02135 [Alphaproteobacteria bacterium]|nr:hypothetical protein [Alphaproteobacteria bacterium]